VGFQAVGFQAVVTSLVAGSVVVFRTWRFSCRRPGRATSLRSVGGWGAEVRLRDLVKETEVLRKDAARA